MLSYLNTIDEIIESGVDTAILPLGSVEQHGSHLPVGTDYLIIDEVSKRIAQRINAYLLPPLPITNCYEHKGKKGSVWMRPSTLYQVLQDIILCLKNQGFKKVIVLIGHGGIFVAAPAIRELNATNDDLQVISVSTGGGKKVFDVLENKEELHAGEKETSCVMYLNEELVKKDLAKKNDYIPDCPREYLNYSSLLDLSETGVWGKPSLATVEKGEKLFDAITEQCLEYIEDAFKHTKKGEW